MLWLLLIGYGLILLVVLLFQRKLIYLPTQFPLATAQKFAAEERFEMWRNEQGKLMGWRIPARGESRGSVLITHGNAGSALDRGYIAKPIHEAGGFDVYVLEYPGYGAREGSPNLKSVLAAGEQALAALPKDMPVYLVSQSIGAGVAAHLAKTEPSRVKGLVMFVPYDDLGNVGQRSMPWLPVKLLLRDRYLPARWLNDYRGPIKFVLAGADEVVPVCFGQQLADGYQGRKDCQLVSGARHNEVTEQSPEWWRDVFEFWQPGK